ncbi:hypothetical protein SAMN05216334_103188 [Nitrosomonas ureae]|uniref:Uncharacterized protein n=1 Tax=Nitrosomonas ureae TaxID=44577 RepID=A0A1H5T0G7_9PROT|nr:hypothetical protein SAMN05216334_103188 [Nitrosomonas ureae]
MYVVESEDGKTGADMCQHQSRYSATLYLGDLFYALALFLVLGISVFNILDING